MVEVSDPGDIEVTPDSCRRVVRSRPLGGLRDKLRKGKKASIDDSSNPEIPKNNHPWVIGG